MKVVLWLVWAFLFKIPENSKTPLRTSICIVQKGAVVVVRNMLLVRPALLGLVGSLLLSQSILRRVIDNY